MDAKALLLKMNARLGAELARVLLGVDDDRVFYCAPAIDARPIVEVAVHAYSSLLGFASIVAGLPWPSDPQPPASTVELLATLDAMRARVAELVGALPDGVFRQSFTLPWGQEINGLDALADGLTHGFVHAGQIAGIRAMGGFPTPPEDY